MTIRAKLKGSISIVLIILLFSSPQDQNAEEPGEGVPDAHAPPFPWIVSKDVSSSEEGKPDVTGPDEGVESEIGQDAEGQILTSSEEDPESVPGEPEERIQGIMATVEDVDGIPMEERTGDHDHDTVSQQGPFPPAAEDGHAQFVNTAELDTVEESSDKVEPVEVKPEDEQRKEEPSELNKSEDSIPSFSEWTKLQLAQRKESIINSIKNKTSLLEGKNFASPDCGAKVVNSNPESQNPSGVISSSHDEYMLNRCTTNVWFILELCEPLTIERLTFGNMELFSSNPHEFEIGVSDRYPTRDWIVFGPYFAPDSRNLHSFHLPPNNSTFGKYLRIVVKSHHGNEHYCPLSLLKVYGKSEYEVLESETTHAQDMETEIPGIIEEEMNDDDDKPVKNSVIGTVVEIIKKATDVLVSKTVLVPVPVEMDDPKPEVATTPNESLPCLTLWQCVHDSEESKPKIIRTLSCESHTLTWMEVTSRWCGWDTCHSFLQRNSIGSPSTPEGLFIAVYGPTIIPILCHYKHPLRVCHQRESGPDVIRRTGAPNETVNGTANLVGFIGQNGLSTEGDDGLATAGGEGRGPTGDGLTPDLPVFENPNFHLPTPPPPVEEPAQKESVFVRLSNRIKALERNQSLSSGYLEELSQRFKKQNEEIHNAHESFRKTLNESLSKCTTVEQSLRYEVRKLNRNLDTLRDLIWRMELQRSGFFLLSFIQLLSTCFLWWYRKDGKVKGQGYLPTTNAPSTSTQLAPEGQDGRIQLLYNQRKRSATEFPVKQKKKKKRKDGGQRAAPEGQTGSLGPLSLGNGLGVSAVPAGRIPSSLSTDSIPLRLPPPISAPQFEFKSSPPIFNGGPSQLPPPPAASPSSSLGVPPTRTKMKMKGGISSSDLSETSSTKSLKKKSKLKSFFFWK